MKDNSFSSWVMYAKNLLQKYDIPADSLICLPPTKDVWRKQVKEAENNKWTEQLPDEAKTKSTLHYMNKSTPSSVEYS